MAAPLKHATCVRALLAPLQGQYLKQPQSPHLAWHPVSHQAELVQQMSKPFQEKIQKRRQDNGQQLSILRLSKRPVMRFSPYLSAILLAILVFSCWEMRPSAEDNLAGLCWRHAPHWASINNQDGSTSYDLSLQCIGADDSADNLAIPGIRHDVIHANYHCFIYLAVRRRAQQTPPNQVLIGYSPCFCRCLIVGPVPDTGI